VYLLQQVYLQLCSNSSPLLYKESVSDKNEPLVGVSIFQVGSTNGTSSDVEGKFKIDVPVGAKLKISYIGYVTQDILISSE
jgi:hypothetical protein